jgi:hypothetical protein
MNLSNLTTAISSNFSYSDLDGKTAEELITTYCYDLHSRIVWLLGFIVFLGVTSMILKILIAQRQKRSLLCSDSLLWFNDLFAHLTDLLQFIFILVLFWYMVFY